MCEITWQPLEDYPSPAISSLWTELDHVMRGGDDVEVVFHDPQRVSLSQETNK